MEVTLYCHQLVPGSDDDMWFMETLEECQAEALESRERIMREDPAADGGLAVYEVVFRMPDVATIVGVLNEPESLLKKCLVSKKLIAVVAA